MRRIPLKSSKISEAQKRGIVERYLNSDLTAREVGEEFGVTYSQVQNYVSSFRRKGKANLYPPPPMSEEEKRDKEAYEKRIQELESKLTSARLKIDSLETMIDVAEETLNIDIRKKPGSRQHKQ